MKSKQSATFGLVLTLPAALLVTSGLLRFGVPNLLISPVLVLGGLLAALALNLIPLLGLSLNREQGGRIAAVTMKIAGKGINWAIVAFCGVLMAVIAGYLFVENFQPR
jgi:hypothetical protein